MISNNLKKDTKERHPQINVPTTNQKGRLKFKTYSAI